MTAMPSEFNDVPETAYVSHKFAADAIAKSLRVPWQMVMSSLRAGARTEAEVRAHLQRTGALK